MMKSKKIYTHGKIRMPILVMGLAVLVVFLVIEFFITTPTPETYPHSFTHGHATSTGGTASSTSSILSKPPKKNMPPPPSTGSTSGASDSVGHAVGISAGGSLSSMSLADMNTYLDQVAALGASWVRFDIEWGLVQYKSPDSSNWTNYDNLINAIAAHHMQGLGIILFTPQWARDPTCKGGAKCPPKNPAEYATFAAQIAARYKGKVRAWEIWNEPNNYDFWATKTDCHAYTTLLQAAYPAIKKADQNAIVITGGLAPAATDKHNISRRDFLTCIYKDGGKNYFDAVGDHPYTFPNLPSASNDNAWAEMSKTNPSLRSIMIANGDADKKIWMTEFGAPTSGPDSYWFVSEQKQSDMVTNAIDLYTTYGWAGPLFWYSLKDNGTSKSTIENFFGLVRYDGSIKPAFTTLKKIISTDL